MVVDYQAMSSVDFAIPDFSLRLEPVLDAHRLVGQVIFAVDSSDCRGEW